MMRGMGNLTTSSDTKSKFKIVLTVLLVLSLAGNAYLFWLYEQKNDELTQASETIALFKSDPESARQASVQELVDQVGRAYDLPDQEPASVATVQDIEQLADNPFFERAEIGDIVLFYDQGDETFLGILFRPSTSRVINVSSLNIDNDQSGLEAQPEEAGSSGPEQP
jgi:hypothetical protein